MRWPVGICLRIRRLPAGRPNEELYEVFTGVEYLGLDGPRAKGPLPHLFQVYLAAHVYGEGDDLGVVAVGKPFDGHGGVEPPAICKDDLLGHVLPL